METNSLSLELEEIAFRPCSIVPSISGESSRGSFHADGNLARWNTRNIRHRWRVLTRRGTRTNEMDSRNLGGESRGASFRERSYTRPQGYERYHLPNVQTLVSLIIIQLHSGYCVPVITVSYERLGRVNNCAIMGSELHSFFSPSSPRSSTRRQ